MCEDADSKSKSCNVNLKSNSREEKKKKKHRASRANLDNLLQTSARIMRSSLYGQRIPAQFCNTEPKCLVSTNNHDTNEHFICECIYSLRRHTSVTILWTYLDLKVR